jgi:hypothetical protein
MLTYPHFRVGYAQARRFSMDPHTVIKIETLGWEVRSESVFRFLLHQMVRAHLELVPVAVAGVRVR